MIIVLVYNMWVNYDSCIRIHRVTIHRRRLCRQKVAKNIQHYKTEYHSCSRYRFFPRTRLFKSASIFRLDFARTMTRVISIYDAFRVSLLKRNISAAWQHPICHYFESF